MEVQQELYLPKFSQAKVAIGKGGAVARRVANDAVVTLEKMLSKKVVLSLHFRHG